MDLTNLENIINGLASFNTKEEVEKIIEDNTEVLVQLQRDQWMEGRGVDGEFIRPFYSEDPYFKSPLAALKYAGWKQKITPNPLRPMDVPNLFINGYYVHNSLAMKISGDTFSFDPNSTKGDEILDKHPNASGLDEEKRKYFAEEKLLPEFALKFKEITTLQI